MTPPEIQEDRPLVRNDLLRLFKLRASSRTARLATYLLAVVGFALLAISSSGIVSIPGLLVLAVVLVLCPVLYHCLMEEGDSHEVAIVIAILAPLAYINYIYALSERAPVGFIDVQQHLFHALTYFSSAGYVDFAHAQTISYSFVGLYIGARFFSAVGGLGLVDVALTMPPILNLTGISVVYIVFRRLVPKKIAQIALVFFGWENVVIVFGSGFITQTPAFLMIFVILYAYVLRRTGHAARTGPAAVSLLALMALSTFSFASTTLGLVVLAAISILHAVHRDRAYRLAVTSAVMLGVFFLTYVIYISGSVTAVFGGIVLLLQQALAAQVATAPNVGQDQYGPIVRVVSFFFWGLFALFFPFFIAGKEARENPLRVTVLLACGAILPLGILLNNAVSFSLARTYEIGLVLISVVVAWGLLRAAAHRKAALGRSVKWLTCVVLILFVSTSIAKLPVYIVGNVSPIRGQEPIDGVPYWSTGGLDSSVAQFLGENARGATLRPDAIIVTYALLLDCSKTLSCLESNFGPNATAAPTGLNTGDLILLRNAFNGHDYTYRNLLPPATSYSSYSLIYDNGDYELFWVWQT